MRRLPRHCLRVALIAAGLISVSLVAGAKPGEYEALEDFLAATMGSAAPPSSVLWVDDELRQQAEAIIGHPPGQLRIRYWYSDGRTAWKLEEIGKERLITMGIVIKQQQIEEFRVLQFRESRGWEIRYPFFTDQFRGVGRNGKGQLDRPIDSISGATLSVRASTRTANFALLLDEYARRKNPAIDQ